MGIYAKYILPRVLDLAMKNKESTRLRAIWVPKARGIVLEVGIGSGLNLLFYSASVQRVYGVDPSLEMQRMARKRLRPPLDVEFLTQSADAPLPLADESIDTVVSTWTLCSIPNPLPALREMRRVLKPEGQFIFIEHGRSSDPRIVSWQDRLNPIWKPIGGGCNLNRKIDKLIESAGFRITELKNEYMPGPKPMTYLYEGIAQKA
jgi:ubiquinone/menaquinone biosynthesis C-methylase UbiE